MAFRITNIFFLNKNTISQSFKDIKKFHSSVRLCSPQGESGHDQPSSGSSSEEYKVPEYYQYNEYSYLDYEVAMSKHRLPQPSSIQQETK